MPESTAVVAPADPPMGAAAAAAVPVATGPEASFIDGVGTTAGAVSDAAGATVSAGASGGAGDSGAGGEETDASSVEAVGKTEGDAARAGAGAPEGSCRCPVGATGAESESAAPPSCASARRLISTV